MTEPIEPGVAGPSHDAGPQQPPPTDAPLHPSPPAEEAPEAPTDAIETASVEPVPVTLVTPPQRSTGGSGGLLRVVGYLGAAVVGAVLVLAGLAATGAVSLPTSSPSPSPSPAYLDGQALGDPTATVTIEIWADYQCPYCALQARGIEPSIERTIVVPGQARMVFRDFAFLGSGNDPDESVSAAVAARCAGRQGAYWYYHDLLFASQQGENQGAFARDRLVALAGFADLDEAKFTACLDDPTVAKAVTAETAVGKGYGVTSTPTLRITGPGGAELLTGIKPLGEVAAAVEQMAKPAASPTIGSSPTPPASAATPAPTSAASPARSASPAPAASAVPTASTGPSVSPGP
jgi:protein-disulfide isomerase